MAFMHKLHYCQSCRYWKWIDASWPIGVQNYTSLHFSHKNHHTVGTAHFILAIKQILQNVLHTGRYEQDCSRFQGLFFIVPLLLIFLADPAAGFLSHPEPGQELVLEAGSVAVQESGLSRLSLQQVEGDDAGRLVHVDADGVAVVTPDLHALSGVPGLVTGSVPAHGPRYLVLPQAARAVFNFAPAAGVHHAHHHPAFILRLPVTTVTQEALLTHHLHGGRKTASQFFLYTSVWDYMKRILGNVKVVKSCILFEYQRLEVKWSHVTIKIK